MDTDITNHQAAFKFENNTCDVLKKTTELNPKAKDNGRANAERPIAWR